MPFIDRQVLRPTIYLSGTCVHDLWSLLELAACLKQRNLRLAIDLKIDDRFFDTVQMTHLARQIEDVIFPLDEVSNTIRITHVGDIDTNATCAIEIERIASVFWN